MSTNIRFEPGAPAQDGFIPLCVPEMGGNEWLYIKECLDTNWVSSVGAFVDRFEKMVADFVGMPYAVATVNGTAALHIALLTAGIGPGDEVLVSDLTFVAPVNAIRYTGAFPVFMDADPLYWQMDPEKVVDFLNNGCQWQNGKLTNRATGRTVKAIIPVHILGHPVDMALILQAAQTYGLTVIEDATESLGASYQQRATGSMGEIGCFSFNGNKVITTGGGGMLVTRNEKLAKYARYLTTQAKDDPIEYVHEEIGYNYRLTNIAGAMGVAQMEKLPTFLEIKRQIANRYVQGLNQVAGITLPAEAPYGKAIFWLYTILVDEQRYGQSSRDLMRKLNAAGIQSRPFWHPIHSMRPYRDCYAHRIEVADQLYQQGLSLPSSVGLKPEDQQRVINAIAG